MSNKFDGDGFSKEPLSGGEAAKHRHMFKEVSESWVNIDGASTFVNGVKILGAIIKVGGPVALFSAGLGLLAKAQGWL